MEDDLDSDMAGSIRSSCVTFNNPVIQCLDGLEDNNFSVNNLVPGDSYIINFMLEVDQNTNIQSKDNKVSIFEVEQFVLDCPTARITELHYDNVGDDENEFIEITALGGESLAGYTVEIHNDFQFRHHTHFLMY